MIAQRLLDELQQLNRDEKLEVLRLLQNDLDDESTEWDDLLSKPGQVFRIPSVRVNFKKAGAFLDPLEEKTEAND